RRRDARGRVRRPLPPVRRAHAERGGAPDPAPARGGGGLRAPERRDARVAGAPPAPPPRDLVGGLPRVHPGAPGARRGGRPPGRERYGGAPAVEHRPLRRRGRGGRAGAPAPCVGRAPPVVHDRPHRTQAEVPLVTSVAVESVEFTPGRG